MDKFMYFFQILSLLFHALRYTFYNTYYMLYFYYLLEIKILLPIYLCMSQL